MQTPDAMDSLVGDGPPSAAEVAGLRVRNADLIAAHAARDTVTLARLYEVVALQHESEGDTDSAWFFVTQAYINALDCGAERAARRLHDRLRLAGREA